MTRRNAAILSVILLIVSFAAINVLSGAVFKNARIDLTQHHLYTLSPGTKDMLAKLKEPITLRFFYSERLASHYQEISGYGNRVRDMLEELVAASHGKLILKIIDPEPFGPQEELAESYGLTGAQNDSGDRIFLGLVGTNLVDGVEKIPFFSPDREVYLEYDIASLIHKLATPNKPKLGIISSLPLQTGPGGYLAALQGKAAKPYVVYQQLKQNFDIQMLKDDLKVVPADIKTLLIAHPGKLNPQALYAIDQFTMRGGRLLVFLDPFSEAMADGAASGQAGANTSSTLGPLLKAWGVDYDPDKVVLDRDNAVDVRYGRGGQAAVMPYLAWIRLSGKDLNRKDLVTADIDNIQLASPGAISPEKGATTKFSPLLTTSAASEEVPSMMLRYGGAPDQLLKAFKPGGKPLVIAARITGPVKSAFPDGPPPAAKDLADAAKKAMAKESNPDNSNDTPLPAFIPKSKSPLNLVLVADSDLLSDRFWVNMQSFLGQQVAQPTAGNGFFVVNAVDQLMGSDDLISLRSRSKADRPFTVVQALKRQAEDRYRAEEQRLQNEIDQTEKRLKVLQGASKTGSGLAGKGAEAEAVLSPAQEREVRKFQEQLTQSFNLAIG
jgi:ABC-type uncharacterized transport system involved in gliding motility auxiliary subunit